MLNSASLTLSEVGLVLIPLGLFIFLPLAKPAIIRKLRLPSLYGLYYLITYIIIAQRAEKIDFITIQTRFV